jgi:gluconokinase
MSHELNRSVLSIDVGTSGFRGALFDEAGNQTQGVVRERVGDFAEVNPDLLVEEVLTTVHDLLAQAETIAISTFWHSLMGVDASSKVWMRVVSRRRRC